MRDEALYLQDIVESAEWLVTELAGVQKQEFLEDDVLRSAAAYKLLIIGEAAAHVSKETQQRHPEIEWGDIVAFRNFTIHGYFGISWERVWSTATINVPALGTRVAQILADEFPPLEDTD